MDDVCIIKGTLSRTIRVCLQDDVNRAAGNLVAELSMADEPVFVIVEHMSLKDQILDGVSKLMKSRPDISKLDNLIVWQLDENL